MRDPVSGSCGRAGQAWESRDGWMSLEAADRGRRRADRTESQGAPLPVAGASGAAPSLTPTEPTAFLQSIPYVAEEADRADVNHPAAAGGVRENTAPGTFLPAAAG